MAELRSNSEIENAAIAWVMELERAAGREPRDTRHRGAPADLESSDRVIEVKAAGTSSRGYDLWLEPRQVEAARHNDAFYVYLVENVRQGDPQLFTLKVFTGEQLQRLIVKAREKHYYELPVPVAEYDSAPSTVDVDPVRRNLYPGALAHVGGWDVGRLDANAHVKHSSQALCISVFGTIAESPRRAELIAEILAEGDVRLGAQGHPKLECEVRGEWDLLGEQGGRHPTSPDVLITWPTAVVTVESKFTEHPEPCRQPARMRSIVKAGGAKVQSVACSGNFEVGSDLATGTDAPCRLMAPEGARRARRYWEIAPRLFRPDAIMAPQRPCPFSDGRYQLMRNLAFAAAWAEREGVGEFGFVLTYVAGWRRARKTESVYEAFRQMLLPEVANRVGFVAYEQIADVLRASGGADTRDLAEWLDQRIVDGISHR